TSPLLLPALLRVVAWAIVVLLLLGDYDGGFGVTAVVALVDLVWSGVAAQMGLLPGWLATVNIALALVAFLIGLLAVISQAQSLRRLAVVADRGVAAAVIFHQRAGSYAPPGQ